MSLFWRAFTTNALVIVVAALALAVTPGKLALPTSIFEALIGALALVGLLVINLALLRPQFVPLRRLLRLMEQVDPAAPGQRLVVTGRGEVATLGATFNAMLERLEQQRSDAMTWVLRAQEDERRRIARNLHDEIGQTLTAALLQLARLAQDVPPDLRDEALGAQEAVRDSLDEMRRVARELRPAALDDLGLSSALREICGDFARHTGLSVSRRIARGLPTLSTDAELVVYRIAQESLTNVARHAGATAAEVRLERVPGAVTLRVSDDGHGFNGSAARSRGGLRGMREWALLVGGELAVESHPGRGVQVRLRVPCEEA
jgi:two-component system sensor histidine kinase UhpB